MKASLIKFVIQDHNLWIVRVRNNKICIITATVGVLIVIYWSNNHFKGTSFILVSILMKWITYSLKDAIFYFFSHYCVLCVHTFHADSLARPRICRTIHHRSLICNGIPLDVGNNLEEGRNPSGKLVRHRDHPSILSINNNFDIVSLHFMSSMILFNVYVHIYFKCISFYLVDISLHQLHHRYNVSSDVETPVFRTLVSSISGHICII